MIMAVVKRDLKLAFRSGGAWLYGVFFFVIFIALSAIALGGSLNVMRPFAPALIWLAVILSTLLSFPAIFQNDYEDGNIAQFKLSGFSLINLCIAKAISFGIISIIPLICAIPLASVIFDLPSLTITGLILSLLIAAPAIIIYGLLSSAILAGRQGGGFLMVLITTPFLIPLLIFGIEAIEGFKQSGFAALEFRVLLGLSLISCAIGIPAAAAALNTNLE